MSRQRISPIYDIGRANTEFYKLLTLIERMKYAPNNVRHANDVIIRSDIVLSRLDFHHQLYRNHDTSWGVDILPDIPSIVSEIEVIREKAATIANGENLTDSLGDIETQVSKVTPQMQTLVKKIYEAGFVKRGQDLAIQAKNRRIILGFTFLSILLGLYVLHRLWRQRHNMILSHDELRNLLDQRETELLRTQRMEAMGQMTAGVAHDFNNLLAVIMANTELAQIDDNLENRNGHLEAILDAVNNGNRLTSNLLVFAGRSALALKVIDMNAVVRDLDHMIRRTMPENIQLNIELAAGLWRIKADRALVESSLMNLVINAYEHLESGGSVTIETANVRLDEQYVYNEGLDLSPGPYVMAAVSDTGAGIADELHDKIFEPFYSTKDRSSGLGLSTAFGFVRKSGGHIKIYSELGQGTTFKMYFPKTYIEEDSDEPVKVPDKITPVTDTNHSVLVVEDNEPLRQSIVKQVRSLGYKCNSVADGQQALDALSDSGPFDLVITDLIMPGEIQGARLASLIQQNYPNIRIIVMSGYPNGATENGNGTLNHITKLMKPISTATLSLAIARELSGERAADQFDS